MYKRRCRPMASQPPLTQPLSGLKRKLGKASIAGRVPDKLRCDAVITERYDLLYLTTLGNRNSILRDSDSAVTNASMPGTALACAGLASLSVG